MYYKKPSKYKNKSVEVDGHRFDSQKEAKYYLYLKNRQAKKEISNLCLQPKFLIQEKFAYDGKTERAIYYVADFSYFENEKLTVIDVKGFKTDVYKLKRKLFLFRYPQLNFIEV